MTDTNPTSQPLTTEQVRHVARLSRLELSDAAIDQYRGQLGAVLRHISMLNTLDLDGVEPMAHPTAAANRWDADEPRTPMSNEVAMKLAPESDPPFIKVPKVLGEGGSA